MAKPIAMKAMPEEIFITRMGKCCPINFPAITPKPVAKTRARAEPAKTYQRFALLADNTRVANWVLSPSSARKMVKKAIRKSFTLVDLAFFVH